MSELANKNLLRMAKKLRNATTIADYYGDISRFISHEVNAAREEERAKAWKLVVSINRFMNRISNTSSCRFNQDARNLIMRSVEDFQEAISEFEGGGKL